MSLLLLVYLCGLGLATAAVAVAVVLIALRQVRALRAARRSARKQELLAGIVEALATDAPLAPLAGALRRHPRQGREIFVELSEVIRGAGMERLVDLGRLGGLEAWLHRKARHGRSHERLLSVEALRLFKHSLRAALDDRDPEVVLAALLAMAEMDQPAPLAEVLRRLGPHASAHTRRLRRLFRRIAAQAPAEVLALAQGKLGNASWRPVAVEALAGTGRPELCGPLAALAADAEPETRVAAVHAVATLRDLAHADAVVTRALADAAWPVRVAALHAARRLELAHLVPALVPLLDDGVWWVRFRAAEALAALGGEGRRALQQAAAGTQPEREALIGCVLAEQRT